MCARRGPPPTLDRPIDPRLGLLDERAAALKVADGRGADALDRPGVPDLVHHLHHGGRPVPLPLCLDLGGKRGWGEVCGGRPLVDGSINPPNPSNANPKKKIIKKK